MDLTVTFFNFQLSRTVCGRERDEPLLGLGLARRRELELEHPAPQREAPRVLGIVRQRALASPQSMRTLPGYISQSWRSGTPKSISTSRVTSGVELTGPSPSTNS